MNRSVIAALVLTASLNVNTAHAVPVQWTAASGGNDHWYDFIAGVSTGSRSAHTTDCPSTAAP